MQYIQSVIFLFIKRGIYDFVQSVLHPQNEKGKFDVLTG